MKILLTKSPAKKDGLVFFLFDKEDITKKLLFSFLDKEEKAYVQKIRSTLELKAQEAKVIILPGSMRKAIFVGTGSRNEFNPRQAGISMRMVIQTARQEKIASLAFSALPAADARDTRDMYEILATNAVMGNFEFIKYKTPPTGGFSFVQSLTFVSLKLDTNIREGLRCGAIIGEETNACRALSNTPGEDMTPAILAAHAVKVARANGIKAAVLDVKKMRALKMGAVLAVGNGSDAPPRFIILEYLKGPKSEKPIVLVGKGVTFDSGGLNLKPTDHIYEMHMDMSGGAAVIHTIAAIARLKLKKNIVVLVPAVENMLSGSSYRPGDVIRTMNGKTIEVMNTDAEGRVILADALEYSKKYNPALVIDVATLTGAAVSALGLFYSGLFTTDKKLEDTFRAIGESVDDRVWPLPLSSDYEDGIKGTFGDWANAANRAEGGGASSGAAFLSQFIKGYRWIHLDIAPRMTTVKQDFLAKGAVGASVRLLIRFLSEDH